ncbi:hypothetical protein DYB32_007814 [Aphanomyces invadans]|uniref:Uncharacterized protein n=1 Tax=Aphanomyces invadans TaxID=157072 RepID=A0A3R7A6B4_9STRA|nr:hypothetical protein DYB32_007814 [Aphanomyces invadans]
MMSSSACGYAIDFGDVFQKKNSSSSRAALMTSSHIGNNENVPPANSRHAESTFHPPRVGGTKQWQLPHYNSIEENAVYLNRQLELQQYGVHDAFTSLVFRASSQDDDADMRRIMDCMHWLLHSRREEMRKSDEMAEQFIRYEKEIHRKNNQIQTLTAQLEAERKTCSDLENQLTAKDAAYTKERLQFKEEKRALERKCIQLTHVDTNYKAQLRKSEVSYERLQKQYNAYLNKASTDKRIACLMDATQDRERSALEARLQEAYQVMRDQDAMIQVALTQVAAHEKDPRSARLDLSGLEDMLEEVALERQEIAIKAQHMETEREQYMVQAERLDKDRLEFEVKRQCPL